MLWATEYTCYFLGWFTGNGNYYSKNIYVFPQGTKKQMKVPFQATKGTTFSGPKENGSKGFLQSSICSSIWFIFPRLGLNGNLSLWDIFFLVFPGALNPTACALRPGPIPGPAICNPDDLSPVSFLVWEGKLGDSLSSALATFLVGRGIPY